MDNPYFLIFVCWFQSYDFLKASVGQMWYKGNSISKNNTQYPFFNKY